MGYFRLQELFAGVYSFNISAFYFPVYDDDLSVCHMIKMYRTLVHSRGKPNVALPINSLLHKTLLFVLCK